MNAVVVGSGPNGLAAAVTLARAGVPVEVFEATADYGGALRSTEFGETGAVIDLGSAVHPFVAASPFFTEWAALERVPYVTPDISYAHPLPRGAATIAYRELERTIDSLGADGDAWRRLFSIAVDHPIQVSAVATQPVLRTALKPWTALPMAQGIVQALLGHPRPSNGRAAALFAGVAAHSGAPLGGASSASVGLVLGVLAHTSGWPLPIGGAGRLADALVADLRAHGGVLHLQRPVRHWDDLPPADVVLLATSARDAERILATGPRRRTRARRTLFPGPGVFKLDLLLSEPLPWLNPEVRQSPTVHLGGPAAELRHAEREVAAGRLPAKPFVMLTQPTVVDPSRGRGRHTAWAYTRVPAGCPLDMTEQILDRIEEFAPGARDVILSITATRPAELEALNPSLIGGDILAGTTRGIAFARRPTLHPAPWRTPVRGVYHCSSAVAPGPGVHGMVGHLAALDALRTHFNLAAPALGSTRT
jgi:phytoene dehydrogenase-like protein